MTRAEQRAAREAEYQAYRAAEARRAEARRRVASDRTRQLLGLDDVPEPGQTGSHG